MGRGRNQSTPTNHPNVFLSCFSGEDADVRQPGAKKRRARRPAAFAYRLDTACYMVRSRCFWGAALAASESSATSTEMLCLMGFQLHFFTSATSAMGI